MPIACRMLLSRMVMILIALQLTLILAAAAQTRQPANYVNPFIGASTSEGAAGIYHGLGKTFPGAATPYGMVQVSPNTITGGDNGSGYSYEHKTIEGFALTQMSGVGWFGDMGNFLVMPAVGPLKTNSGKEGGAKGYRAIYAKSSEQASAGYYSVLLTESNIKAELTAAPHSGFMRFTFPKNDRSRIQVDLARRVGGTSTTQYVRVVDSYTIEGWMKCTPEGGGWGNGEGQADYTVFFYAQFSKPITKHGIWSADIPRHWTRKREDVESERYQQLIANAEVLPGLNQKQGDHLGFYAEFDTKENEQILLKSGISYISIHGAKNNLKSEIPDWEFDKVHEQARESWNKELSKIAIEGGSEEEKISFYTALYHTMIDPRIFQDIDGNYSGGDGRPHRSEGFTKRTVFSGWDVFRSQMPLQTIINPQVVSDIINSLVTLAKEKNKDYLERWELLNAYSGCMIGNPAVSVITDAYKKGIRNFNVNSAYQLCVNSVEMFGNGEKGYTANPVSIGKTLEYAYFDWCVSEFAKALGNSKDAEKYYLRSKAYKNVFDPEKGWFRPKMENGSWEAWPEEGRLKQWYGCFETNPYQQGWFIPQDVPGMVAIMGGEEKVLKDLLNFFEKAPENMMWNDYYNHANEPVHHVPFLFNHLNNPQLTQKWTRLICSRAYHNSVEGLVGNEDVGQMSAWYVLAASGLHPLCPGDTRYEITSPLFNKIEITTDSKFATGKKFTVLAKDNSPENIYIQSAKLNGKAYDKCFLDFKDIVSGGVLELVMGKTASNWGKR